VDALQVQTTRSQDAGLWKDELICIADGCCPRVVNDRFEDSASIHYYI
jgi:hypothetical protein